MDLIVPGFMEDGDFLIPSSRLDCFDLSAIL